MKFKLVLVVVAVAMTACAPDTASMGTVAGDSSSHKGVFGGDEVSPQDIIARTTVGVYNDSVGYLCTGSLYGSNMVITAAHCLVGPVSKITIHFGVKMRGAVQIRRVISGMSSEYYTGKIQRNMGDIAILKYEGSLPSDYGFRSVSLLKDARILKKGTPIIAAGYGIKRPTMKNGEGILRKVTLKVKDPHYSETEISVKQGVFKGVCQGDSGGPAFVKGKDGTLYLWGVTSNGAGIPVVRACMFRTVFTRVDAYLPWITEAAGRL